MTAGACAVLDRRRVRYVRLTDDELTAEAVKVETHAGEVGACERHLVDEEREYRQALAHAAATARAELVAAMAPPRTWGWTA